MGLASLYNYEMCICPQSIDNDRTMEILYHYWPYDSFPPGIYNEYDDTILRQSKGPKPVFLTVHMKYSFIDMNPSGFEDTIQYA